jgi:hypothetical protein
VGPAYGRRVSNNDLENDTESFTPQVIRDAVGELTALVDQRLPERFWPSEAPWRAVLTALVSRMTALLESLAVLADPPRQPDALILVRALYEHLITFAWLAIDPRPRVDEYLGHSMVHKRTLANDAANYGLDLLSDFERMVAEQGKTLPPVDQRAAEVDAYWGQRIKGLHQDPASGPKDILTLRGLYILVYRQASRQAHAAMESPDECIVEDGTRHLVLRKPKGDYLTWSAFAIPLFSMALVVAHERLGWPDETKVREINDAFHEIAGAITDSDPTLV